MTQPPSKSSNNKPTAPANPLEKAYHELTEALEDSGLTVVDLPPQTGIKRYQAHFVSRRTTKETEPVTE